MRGLSEILYAKITAVTCGRNYTMNTNADTMYHMHLVLISGLLHQITENTLNHFENEYNLNCFYQHVFIYLRITITFNQVLGNL